MWVVGLAGMARWRGRYIFLFNTESAEGTEIFWERGIGLRVVGLAGMARRRGRYIFLFNTEAQK